MKPYFSPKKVSSGAQYIDSSKNDNKQDCKDESKKETKMIGPRCEAWHCEGPLGESAGPFSLPMLKIWSDVNPYALKYRVWKVGESKDQAIFLSDLIHGPNEHSNDNFEGNEISFYFMRVQKIDFG